MCLHVYFCVCSVAETWVGLGVFVGGRGGVACVVTCIMFLP